MLDNVVVSIMLLQDKSRLHPTPPLCWVPSLEVFSLLELPLPSLSAASSTERAEGSQLLSPSTSMLTIVQPILCSGVKDYDDILLDWMRLPKGGPLS